MTKSQSSKSERRQYVRFNTSIGLSYRIPDKEIEGLSRADNASRNGLRISVDKDLGTGTILELEINIPGEIMPVFATGEVIWIKKQEKSSEFHFDAGVRLTNIDKFDRSRILDYVYNEWMRKKHPEM